MADRPRRDGRPGRRTAAHRPPPLLPRAGEQHGRRQPHLENVDWRSGDDHHGRARRCRRVRRQAHGRHAEHRRRRGRRRRRARARTDPRQFADEYGVDARHDRSGRRAGDRRRRRRRARHAHRDARRAERSPACAPASTCRSRSRCATTSPTAKRVVAAQQRTGLVAMCGHTRRFNPSHQWVHQRVEAGRLRHPADGRADVLLPAHQHERARSDRGAGPTICSGTTPRTRSTCSPIRPAARSWTPTRCRAHRIPNWGSPWTCRSSWRPRVGAICTLSLSFNNDGPFGTIVPLHRRHRHVRRELRRPGDGHGEPIDVSGVAVSMNGIELQDREFFAAIAEGREPNASVAQVLDCYRVLDRLERQLRSDHGIRRCVPMSSIDAGRRRIRRHGGEPARRSHRVDRRRPPRRHRRRRVPVGGTSDRGPAVRSLLVRAGGGRAPRSSSSNRRGSSCVSRTGARPSGGSR